MIKSEILSGQKYGKRVAEMIRNIARMELGETLGKVSGAVRRETWWWNQEVQEKLKDKRKAEKIWDTIRHDASKLAHKTAKKQAQRKVAKAKNKAFEELYKNWRKRRGEMSCLR